MEKACRKCRVITEENECPVCRSKDLTTNWKGIIFVTKPEESEIAKKANIKSPGKYAVKVL